LPREDKQQLLELCRPVTLDLSHVLCQPGTQLAHAYFPLDSCISLIATGEGNAGVEVGMIGAEGMLGAHLALGVRTVPLHSLVQGPGQALRIAAAPLAAQLIRSPLLQKLLLRYTYVTMRQQAISAACLRFHQTGPRLARWVLMSHDRAGSDHFHMTQEFLAYMLGMRRVGITRAAGDLQRAGLIAYHRGDFQVLDRAGLEAAACTCYATDLQAYADGMGPQRAKA
jgi:CRP-like cAMP-binding protein